MVNLSTILEMLFKRVDIQEVLDGEIDCANFTKETFVLLGRSYFRQYSSLELENLYEYFLVELRKQEEWRVQDRAANSHLGFNVFEVLLNFADQVLLEDGEDPVCNYPRLLRWRMVSHQLEENLFTTAFLAARDLWRENHHRQQQRLSKSNAGRRSVRKSFSFERLCSLLPAFLDCLNEPCR